MRQKFVAHVRTCCAVMSNRVAWQKGEFFGRYRVWCVPVHAWNSGVRSLRCLNRRSLIEGIIEAGKKRKRTCTLFSASCPIRVCMRSTQKRKKSRYWLCLSVECIKHSAHISAPFVLFTCFVSTVIILVAFALALVCFWSCVVESFLDLKYIAASFVYTDTGKYFVAV